MNLDKIKKIIIRNDIPDDYKEQMILDVISSDDNVIVYLLAMLNKKRFDSKELIGDLNLELSRAHIYIETCTEEKNEDGISRDFIIEKIGEFYNKYKGKVIHCFNRFNSREI